MPTVITDVDFYSVMPPTTEYPGVAVIRQASADVALYLRSAVYDVSPTDGLPVLPELREAVVTAVAEQAVALVYQGAIRASNPLGRPLDMAQIGGTIWKATGGQIADGYAIPDFPGGRGLCPNASGALVDFPRVMRVYG
ncbi:hypothetical protein [Tessaracoccus sp.]